MFRPVRRARQRPIQDEVVGILPEEEAALRRALYASLQDEKKSPEKHEDQHKEAATTLDDVHQFATLGSPSHQPSSSGFDGDSWTISPLKKIRLESLSDCSSPFSSSPGRLGQLSGYSSPVGSPGSVGSSLKLVLSPSSCSTSSSNWSSSEASSPENTETGSEATFPKKQKKDGNTASRKEKGKGKGKLSVDSFLFGTSPSKEKTPPKGKCSPKISVSTPKSNKSPKFSKTPPKLSKSPKNPQGGKKGTPQSKERYQDYGGNRSKQLQALVLHDHCYFGGLNHEANDSKAQERANTGTKRVQSSPTSPCTFQAQRKFAQNPAPLHSQRSLAEEAEKVHKLKEVPKTEDFITFLCLRGSNRIPENFRKFGRPWTPRSKRVTGKNGQRLRLVRTLPGGNGKGSRMKSAKKLDFTASAEQLCL